MQFFHRNCERGQKWSKFWTKKQECFIFSLVSTFSLINDPVIKTFFQLFWLSHCRKTLYHFRLIKIQHMFSISVLMAKFFFNFPKDHLSPSKEKNWFSEQIFFIDSPEFHTIRHLPWTWIQNPWDQTHFLHVATGEDQLLGQASNFLVK